MNQPVKGPGSLSARLLFMSATGTVFARWRAFAASLALPLVLSLVISGSQFALVLTASKEAPRILEPMVLSILGLLPIALFGVIYGRRLHRTVSASAGGTAQTALRTVFSFAYLLLFLAIVTVPCIVIVFFTTIGPMFLMSGTAAMFFVYIAGMLPLRLAMPWDLLRQAGFWGGGIDTSIFTHMFAIFGPFLVPFDTYMPWVWLFSLPVLYFITRFSLVLPAASLGRNLGLGGSWRATRGSGLQLFSTVFGIAVVAMAVRIIFLFVFPRAVYPLLRMLGVDVTHGDAVYWCVVAAQHVCEFVLTYLGIALIVAALTEAHHRLVEGPGTERG